MKTDIDTFATLDTDAAGVGITQRGSRVRLDANQHPMYSVSFKTQGAGAGTDVDSLSKFILDSIGNVLAVDSFKLTTAQQAAIKRSEEHTSELQSRRDLVCRLLLEKKN